MAKRKAKKASAKAGTVYVQSSGYGEHGFYKTAQVAANDLAAGNTNNADDSVCEIPSSLGMGIKDGQLYKITYTVTPVKVEIKVIEE